MAGETILVIEPDIELQKNLENILTLQGFKPLQAYNQNEGVKLAISKSPQLLLLHLPLDSIVHLLQRLAQIGRLIPSIIIVDEATSLIPIELARLGVQDYVVHSFSTEDILTSIRRVLRREMRTLNYQELTQDLTRLNQNLEQQVKKYKAVLGPQDFNNPLEDLDAVLNRVTEAVISSTGADSGYLFLVDEKTNELRLRAAQNLSKSQAEVFSALPDESIIRSIIRSGKPILLSGSNGQYLELKGGYPVKSLLNVPLKVEERVIGVLGIDNQTANARFSLMDLRRITELADTAAAAVINSYQYAEARQEIGRHVEEVATLQAVSSQLNHMTEFDNGAQLVLSLALNATNAEAGVLAWLTEDTKNPLRYVSLGGFTNSVLPLGESSRDRWWDDLAIQEVIKSGQPALAFDLGQVDNGHKNGKSKAHAHSRLTVPLRRAHKVTGAINLESTAPNAFTQEDLRFISSIADQIGLALEGATFQEKAEAERERLALLMKAVDNGIWLVDSDLQIIAQNKAAHEILGWADDEVVGCAVSEFEAINNDTAKALGNLLEQAIEKESLSLLDEAIFLTGKDKKAVLVSIRIIPIMREEGLKGAILAFQPAKKGDEQVRFEFANMATHLLRTPLASIQTAIDMLLGVELSVDEQRAMLTQMREQSRRMREFVKELLEMSRLEAGIVRIHAEPVILLPLLNRVLGLIQSEESRHTFSLLVADSLPIITADLAKTELVLVNLLRNAVSRCQADGQITMSVEKRDEEVVISIADNGEAIPLDQLDRIFSQFYPIDSTGSTIVSTYHLGLYSTKRLIELQGGRVWVESQPGKGSRFSFSLPVWR